MEPVEKEFEKLFKRQKLFHKSTTDFVDKAIQQLQQSKTIISKDGQLMSQSLAQAEKWIGEISNETQQQTKEYYSAMSKFSKSLEKKFTHNLELAARPEPFEGKESALHESIATHLIREGQFDLCQAFCQESGLELKMDLQEKFREMFEIMRELRERRLNLALQWARRNRVQLNERQSHLEFRLHQLQFLQLLLPASSGNTTDQSMEATSRVARALEYARHEFSAFGEKYIREIQRLMGAVLYATPRPAYLMPQSLPSLANGQLNKATLANSPYADLIADIHWQNVEQQFTREFCSLLGLSQEPPLQVAVSCGASAVPTMIKLRNLMDERRRQRPKVEMWSAEDELPVEIPLLKNQIYHSIFSCPVSREQTTAANPPMMLPCGHVISRDSLIRLSKGGKMPTGLNTVPNIPSVASNPAATSNNSGSDITTNHSLSGHGGTTNQSQDQLLTDVFRGINVSAKLKCPYCPTESTAGQSIRVAF